MSITGLLPPTVQFLPYIDNIVAGPVEYFAAQGTRSNVTTATNGNDIWSGTATTLPIPPSAGEQMTVVSSNVADDNGLTGINTVIIHYLDTNGNEQTETITMDGTTPVNTAATNIRFINEFHAESVGTAGGAVGTIIIYKFGTPATIYSLINPGHFKHSNTARMVPKDKVCLIESYAVSGGAAAGGKSAQINLKVTSHHGILLPVSPNPVFLKEAVILVFNSAQVIKFETPVLVPAFAVIKCTSYTIIGGADITANWYGKLVSAPI